MEHETEKWLNEIADIITQHKRYLETKTDINYDELGLDYLGGSFLFLYQTAINDGIISDDGKHKIDVNLIEHLNDEERCDFVLAAGTSAAHLKKYRNTQYTMTDDDNSLSQLSKAFLYLYKFYYKDIDTKLV